MGLFPNAIFNRSITWYAALQYGMCYIVAPHERAKWKEAWSKQLNERIAGTTAKLTSLETSDSHRRQQLQSSPRSFLKIVFQWQSNQHKEDMAFLYNCTFYSIINKDFIKLE